jgi:hypothetical protein
MCVTEIGQAELEEKSICGNGKGARPLSGFVLAWNSDLRDLGNEIDLFTEVHYESLPEHQLRGLWPHRLLGCNALPAMPMGFEGRSSCKRNYATHEA